MAEICYGVVGDKEVTGSEEQSSRAARRKRMEIRKFKYVPSVGNDNIGFKKPKLTVLPESISRSYSLKDDRAGGGFFDGESNAKFGVASVCGRRREMEDAVAIHPSFIEGVNAHYFGVYDGHGCSHVCIM